MSLFNFAKCISRLIGEKVRKGLTTTAPEEARTNWKVFWDYLSRVYGEYDHFSEAQAKVVEYKPKEGDTPLMISRELTMRIGEMASRWVQEVPIAKALTVWQLFENIKENLYKYSNYY